MNRKLRKRIAAGLMALCMVTLTPSSVLARTTEEVEAEQAALEEERQQLQSKLEELRAAEGQKQEYLETLQKQIDVLQNQINTARQDIEDLNDSISELDLRLKKSQEEVSGTIEQFKERVTAIYRAGSVSTLEILLDSNSFTDFSMRSEMLGTMSRHDQELIDKLRDYMDATRDEREEREKQKEMVAELKKSLVSKQKEVDGLYEETTAAITELQGAQDATAGELQRNQEEIEARDREIAEILEEQKRRAEEEERRRKEEAEAAANNGASSNPNASGGFGGVTWAGNSTGGVDGFHPCWPMPGVTYISDEFGGARNHGGMDIAGPFGTPIVAAESGTVIRAWTSDTWGMGWGYHVMISHNGTYSTLYAHMSSVAVYNGQTVSQGEIVGYEGSTGDSTGPHLHFEVYQNGTRVNPRNFL